MISGWRKDRRLGAPPLIERLEIYWKPTLVAFAATAVLVPFVLWIKFGWPPALNPRGMLFIWCATFASMMLAASEFAWRQNLWKELIGLVIITTAIITTVWHLALPVGTAAGLLPPLVYPVNP